MKNLYNVGNIIKLNNSILEKFKAYHVYDTKNYLISYIKGASINEENKISFNDKNIGFIIDIAYYDQIIHIPLLIFKLLVDDKICWAWEHAEEDKQIFEILI